MTDQPPTAAHVLRQARIHPTERPNALALELRTDAGASFFALDFSAASQVAAMLNEYVVQATPKDAPVLQAAKHLNQEIAAPETKPSE